MIRTTLIALTAFLLSLQASIVSGQTALPSVSYEKKLRLPATGDRFRLPLAVHADLHFGEVFVCDRMNSRIVIYSDKGHFAYQIPGGASFGSPVDVAVDHEGYILVVGTTKKEEPGFWLLDFDGVPIEHVPLKGFPADIEPPLLTAIALSPAGTRVCLGDRMNSHLWIANREGKILRAVDLAEGLSEEERLEYTLDAVDIYGNNILVSNSKEGKVYLFDLDGNPKGFVGLKATGKCKTGRPVSAAMDRDGNVWVLDKQRMLVTVWDPEDNKCMTEFLSIGGHPGGLYHPASMALDGQGRLYISQGFQGRVQVFSGGPPALGGLKK